MLHYRILGKIGEGGMGQVYKAEDTKLGRHVALKLLAAESNQDITARRRLLAEAQSASVLNHPNIVTIYAIEEDDGLDFIVMEYVEGDTLAVRLALNGALPLPSLLDVGIQIADALEAAHATGLIHRDIKPGNIMLTPKGVVKVTDFGVAKVVRVNTDAIDREALTLAANLTDVESSRGNRKIEIAGGRRRRRRRAFVSSDRDRERSRGERHGRKAARQLSYRCAQLSRYLALHKPEQVIFKQESTLS